MSAGAAARHDGGRRVLESEQLDKRLRRVDIRPHRGNHRHRVLAARLSVAQRDAEIHVGLRAQRLGALGNPPYVPTGNEFWSERAPSWANRAQLDVTTRRRLEEPVEQSRSRRDSVRRKNLMSHGNLRARRLRASSDGSHSLQGRPWRSESKLWRVLSPPGGEIALTYTSDERSSREASSHGGRQARPLCEHPVGLLEKTTKSRPGRVGSEDLQQDLFARFRRVATPTYTLS